MLRNSFSLLPHKVNVRQVNRLRMSFRILLMARTDGLPTSCLCSSARARARVHAVLKLEPSWPYSRARASRASYVGRSKPHKFSFFGFLLFVPSAVVKKNSWAGPAFLLNSKPCWATAATAAAAPLPPPARVRIRSGNTNS